MITDYKSLVQECVSRFGEARGKIIDALESLWKVHEQEAWKGEYESFSEFCEEGLKITKGTGSMYVQIYDRYVNEGGLSVKLLRDVNPRKLYQALKQPGSPDKQFAIAQTWNDDDFKDDKKEDGHEHEFEMFCKHCWKKP